MQIAKDVFDKHFRQGSSTAEALDKKWVKIIRPCDID